ncbi:beta strand repeat-containing protein, partial [Nemorincola caseinilytica]|uniref:beta strand repeat-containing protein n=1 Tax=Nemorincola caseinilytica TaxID=2054315 RepID=UPI0031EF32CB
MNTRIFAALILFFFFGSVATALAQPFTETFESITDGGSSAKPTVFVNNGQSFTCFTASCPTGGTFGVWIPGDTWTDCNGGHTNLSATNYGVGTSCTAGNCTGTSSKFLDAAATGANTNQTYSILTTDAALITVKGLHLFISTDNAATPGGGSVTFRGKRGGVTKFTLTKTTGFVSNFSTNNGFTYINFATEGGTDNSLTNIDELEIQCGGGANYMAVDNFVFGNKYGPLNTTTAASSITSSGAGLNGTINDNGIATSPIIFEYSTSPTLASGVSSVTATPSSRIANAGSTGVTASVSGLSASATYYYRLVSTNAGGTTSGAILSFTTPVGVTPPTATTSAATSFTASAATLNGSVNANDDNTTVIFEYSTVSDLSSGVTTVSATPSSVTGSSATSVSATISGLTAGNTYYFRVKGTNAGGATTGSILSFSILTATTSKTNGNACGFTCDGTASVTPSGGTPPYTYMWSNGHVSSSISGLCPGTYTCTIADAATVPQEITRVISITAPPAALTLSAIGNNGPIIAGSDLSLTSTATGGTPPYTYSWAGPNSFTNTNQNPTITAATTAATGVYTLTLSDANSCVPTGTNTTAATVNAPTPPTVVTSAASITSSYSVDLPGSVNANGSSSTVIFEYSTVSDLSSGVHTVSATPSPVTGSSATAVTATVIGLTPGSTYYFRVSATNAGGTTQGSILDLTMYGVGSGASVVIADGTKVTGSGALQMVLKGMKNLVNNGTISANSGTLRIEEEGTEIGGSGSTMVNDFVIGYPPVNDVKLYAPLSVRNNALISGVSNVNSLAGALYIRTDINPSATITMDGDLYGSVSGLVTKATVTSGTIPSYNSVLSTNMDGGNARYQWQSSPDNSVWTDISGATDATYTATVTATTYYRTHLSHAVASIYDQFTPAVQLTISASGAPAVATAAATAVSTTGATLNASVNANTASTTVTFAYSTVSDLSSGVTTVTATPSPVTGSSATAVTANITGLASSTTYYFRVMGENSYGTTNGSILSFATAAPAQTIAFSATTVDINENAGTTACPASRTIDIPVSITGTAPTGGSPVVAISVGAGGTARSGVDFVLNTTSLTFPAGSATPQNVSVTIFDNVKINDDRFFYLHLAVDAAGSSAGVGANENIRVNIINDDTAVAMTTPLSYVSMGDSTSSLAHNGLFAGFFTQARAQYLFKAADLTAAGISSTSPITALKVKVMTKNSTLPYEDYTISMANSSATTMSMGFAPEALTTVYTGDVTTVLGWNELVFSSGFTWNGTSNLVVNICWRNASGTPGGTDWVTAKASSGYNGLAYTTQSAGTSCTNPATTVAGSLPVLQFSQTPVSGGGDGTPVETNTTLRSAQVDTGVNASYFYNTTGSVVAMVRNASQDLGCVNAAITTSGNGFVPSTFDAAVNRSVKEFSITPTTGSSSTYDATFYYTNAELSGVSPSSLYIVKTNEPTNATIHKLNSKRVTPTITTWGSNVAFTGTFKGFSGFFLIDGDLPGAAEITTTSYMVGPSITATLTATPTDPAYTYEWVKDAVIIPGATNSTYETNQAGGYTVIIRNPSILAEDESDILTLTDNVAPVFAGGATGTMTICQDASATAINSNLGVVDEDASQTLTWSVTGTPLHGTLGGFNATASTGSGTITPTGLTYTPTAGYHGTDAFTIQVSDGTATASRTINVTVNQTPTVNDPADQSVCNNATTTAVTFSGSPVSGTTYNWTNSTTSIGLTSLGNTSVPTFTATNSTAANVVATVTVTPVANSCPGSSQTFTYTVKPTPDVADPTDQAVCNNASTTAISFSGAVSGTVYNWTNNTSSIGLATTGNTDIASFTAVNTGSTPVVATVTVTPTAAGCTGSSQTFTYTVNPTPTVSDPTDQSVCNNANTTAVNFTGAVSGTVYTWTNDNTATGLASSGNTDIASFTATNSTNAVIVSTVTVTPSANSCTGSSQTFTISVRPTPVLTDPTDQAVCNNTVAPATNFVSTVGGTTYTWVNDNTATGLATSGNTHISAFVATNIANAPIVSTVTVTPTAASCVGATQTFTYTVNPTPTVNTPSNQSVCNTFATTAVTFTGYVPVAVYTWTNSNTTTGLATSGTGDIASFTATNSTSATTVSTVNVTPSAYGCTGTTRTFTISVKPTPTVADPADQAVCNTAFTTAVTFTGTVASTQYDWTNTTTSIGLASAGNGNISSFAATNTGSIPVVATVVVTPSAAGCTGSSQSFNYTVNPTPAVADPADKAVCNNTSVAATNFTGPVSGTLYSWTNTNAVIGLVSGGTGDIASFTGTNSSTSAAETAVVTVTPSANGCTGASQNFTIRVNPTPTVNAVSSSAVCANNTVPATTFTGGSASNVYTWSNSNTAIGTVANGTGNIGAFTGTNPGLTTISGTFTVTPSLTISGLTCAGSPKNFTVTVYARPQVTAIGNNGPICADATLNLTSTIAGGVTPYDISWTGPSFSSAVEDPSIPNATTASSGTYSLTVTDANNCATSSTSTTTAVVNPRPAMVTVSNDGPICAGSTLGLFSTATGGTGAYTYSWTGPNSFNSLVRNPTITSATTAATGVYSVVVTDAANCTATGTRTTSATVNSLPTVASITASPTALCTGSAITLTAGATSGAGTLVSYNWTGPNSYSATTAAGTTSLTATTTAASGIYSLSVTYTGTGCTSNRVASSTVTVVQRPIVYAVMGGGSYCAGGTGVTVQLSGSDIGKTYQLYRDGMPVGSTIAGTGAPIVFPSQTVAGNYIVMTGLGSPCPTMMSGSATVAINPLPVAYTVTGGGSYCVGGTGMPVGLSDGEPGIDYTLYYGSTALTSAAGMGVAFSFGNMTGVGTYTVSAVNNATGCTNNMLGSATISTNALPNVYNMTGSGSYCASIAGLAVGLSNSTNGVTYQLYNGATPVGVPVVSPGGVLSFGVQPAGVYSATATSAVGCTSNMSGTAIVMQNALPTVFTTGGGGSYCSGGTGFPVTLSGSTAGVNYQLYNGSTATGAPVAGTGSALSFGTFTAAGTYTVRATNAITTCTANMSGSAVINIDALPTAFTVGGGGSYCIGGAGQNITLSGSQSGVSYQMYRSGTPVGTAVPGNGSSLNFGLQTTAGSYTMIGVNTATGCSTGMTGSATVSVNALPVIYPITGGGNYCTGGTGVTVGLGGSQTGVNYMLYNGAAQIGSTMGGTNSPISFGTQTLTGTYTIFAINPTTGCSNNMSGTASIGINPLPTVYPVTGTGAYCAGGTGVAVGLSGSSTGVNYSLSMGATLVSVMSGTGSALNFGNQLTAGTYTVQATNSVTGCQSNMNGSAVITVNALPNVFAVSASGSSYCAGGTGVTIGLTGTTQAGVDYQLYNGATASGAAVSGGAAVSFGLRTAAGTYTVLATNTTTGCTRAMSGTASITINPLPTVYAVTGGGSYCAGGSGQAISLSGSETGVNYQLYNGAATVGTAVAGSGSAIGLGTQTASGTYTVLATNATTACTRVMSGSAGITINALPVAQIVNGGGAYCAGGTGVAVGLGSSQTGINYQLYNGLTAMGSAVPGTGSAISFGSQTMSGTYMVKATDPVTGCTNNMTGTASVSINAVPTIYNVTGGGSYCAGSTGVSIGLSGSTAGVSYQLYNGSLPVGTAATGTGAALSFGIHTLAATYYVGADNGTCTSTMNGSATVVQNALPLAQTLTGGGAYCAGGTGVHVGIGNSQVGVSYQLYRDGVPTGGLVAGTGLAVDFGSMTAGGDYTTIGYNSGTGCTNAMTGTVSVSVNALPAVQTVTGGGSYCAGGSGVTVGLGGSAPGVSYQLYNGSAVAGTAGFGTGTPIDIGTFTVAGTYSAQATDLTTGCMSDMSGVVTISINALPQLHTVSGGGTICQNSAGAAITLNNSNTGINYQLYNGTSTVG